MQWIHTYPVPGQAEHVKFHYLMHRLTPFTAFRSGRCTIVARAGAGPSGQPLQRAESATGLICRRQLLAALAGVSIASVVLPPSEASAADGASVVGPPVSAHECYRFPRIPGCIYVFKSFQPLREFNLHE